MKSYLDGNLASKLNLKLLDYGEITLHAKNQFEIKLDYKVNPNAKESQFKLETYFFIPHSFRINSQNYPKMRFYEDMQVYIRFNPILISLTEVINFTNEISPLTRSMKLLNSISGGDPSQNVVEQIIHELKMLGVIVTSTIEKHVGSIRLLLQTEPITHQNLIDAQKQIHSLLEQIQAFNYTFRQKRDQFLSPFTSIELKETIDYLLEYISIIIQRELTECLTLLQQNSLLSGDFNELIEKIKALLKNERDFRSACGFNSILNIGEENEEFTYRYSILKKYISNVLYLTARPETTPRAIKELAYAAAAGVAMLATILLTYISQLFLGDYTLPFISAIIIGYMIKDRLKDWLRILFGQGGIQRKGFDYKSIIRDNEGNKIGSSKERFGFIQDIPQDIMNLRSSSHITKIEGEGKPENVIKYLKLVKLFPKKITEAHERVLDTSDIIRFDISNFLSKIENPYNFYEWYNIENQMVEQVKAARVYHLNLIVKFTSYTENTEQSDLKRIRLILDKNGIKRIETIFR